MTVDQLGDYLKQHWPDIREQLLNGTYEEHRMMSVGCATRGVPGAALASVSRDYEGGMTHAAIAAPIGTPSSNTATAMISLVAWLSIGASSSAMVGSTMARHPLSLGSSALEGSCMPNCITDGQYRRILVRA